MKRIIDFKNFTKSNSFIWLCMFLGGVCYFGVHLYPDFAFQFDELTGIACVTVFFLFIFLYSLFKELNADSGKDDS